MATSSQFSLFKTRRFLPLFLTQFLGAFNDNLFKNAMLVMIAFYGLSMLGLNDVTLVNIAAGVFILPFFLFSATAGQLAEKYDKATIARWVKILEIVIMLLAAVGFVQQSAPILFICLFAMGVHSAIFGPMKYSVLPQYLNERELLGGNGLIEMGTFVAILLGQIGGTLLIKHFPGNPYVISGACIVFAVIGYLTSRSMPSAPPLSSNVKINFNILDETFKIIGHARKNPTVFNSLMGISWFWFFGAVYLTQLPAFSKDVLGGSVEVYTLLMALFSIGVGIGSMLCEKLSGHKVELGLVPLGSIGLSLFGIDLYFATPSVITAHGIDALPFISDPSHWRIMADLVLLGTFGGFFIVPLYALIQLRSEPEYRSRMIAANNILNSCFMVAAAGMSIVIFKLGANMQQLLLIVALMNIVVAIYIYTLVPEFLMRFLVWIITHTMYRVRHVNLDNIPDSGPCVLVCNHVSFMDALILAGAIRRPVRFVMDHRIFKIPVLSFIFKTAGAIPIAPAKEDATMKDLAFEKVARYLAEGEVVCIFPEGKITQDGQMNLFKPGIEEIIRRSPVLVVPLALSGLWGSFFSRKDGSAMLKMPRRAWSKITLIVGTPVAASDASAIALQTSVHTLRGDVL